MGTLSPTEVEDAAPHFLERGLLDIMRQMGHLPCDWPTLLAHLRQHFGFTFPKMREQLHATPQAKGETLARYAARFEELR